MVQPGALELGPRDVVDRGARCGFEPALADGGEAERAQLSRQRLAAVPALALVVAGATVVVTERNAALAVTAAPSEQQVDCDDLLRFIRRRPSLPTTVDTWMDVAVPHT